MKEMIFIQIKKKVEGRIKWEPKMETKCLS